LRKKEAKRSADEESKVENELGSDQDSLDLSQIEQRPSKKRNE